MGVMAAALSKSKQVGIIGPIEVGDAKLYNNGFAAGANNREEIVGWAENAVHDATCVAPITLTSLEYESVRGYAPRFAIARNHENPEAEFVVDELDLEVVLNRVRHPSYPASVCGVGASSASSSSVSMPSL